MLKIVKSHTVFGIFLAILCLVTYSPSFHSEFKLDDFTYQDTTLAQNFAHWTEAFIKSDNQHYNPLNYLINIGLFKLWDKNVVPYHLFNTVVFYLNSLLLFFISYRMTNRLWPSMIAATLFCLHPINAEIMNQIVFNTVLLSAMLFQMVILLYDHGSERLSPLRLTGACFFTLIALLTLETAVMIPVILFLWEIFVRKKSKRQALRNTLIFWLLAIAYVFAWKMISQGNSVSGDILQKINYYSLSAVTFLGTLAKLIFWYLAKLFVPINSIWIYAIEPLGFEQSLFNLLLLIVLLFGLYLWIFRLTKSPTLQFAVLWFLSGFIFLLPGSFAHAETGLIVEPYWFYVHSMGFFILVGFGLDALRLHTRWSLFLFILLAVVVFCFLGTQRINFVAKTEKKYSEYWLKISSSPIPLTALAKISLQEGDYLSTLAYYNYYYSKYAHCPFTANLPWMVELSMAQMYVELKMFDQAQKLVDSALKKNPKSHIAYKVLGNIAVLKKDYQQAEFYFQKSLSLSLGSILVLDNLANLYLLTHQEQKALNIFESLSQSKIRGQDRISVYTKLAILRYKLNNPRGSLQAIETILKEYPQKKTYYLLIQGFEYHQIHQIADLVVNQGLNQYPLDSQLYLYSGIIRANQGQYQDALLQWSKGKQFAPNDSRFSENEMKIRELIKSNDSTPGD